METTKINLYTDVNTLNGCNTLNSSKHIYTYPIWKCWSKDQTDEAPTHFSKLVHAEHRAFCIILIYIMERFASSIVDVLNKTLRPIVLISQWTLLSCTETCAVTVLSLFGASKYVCSTLLKWVVQLLFIDSWRVV